MSNPTNNSNTEQVGGVLFADADAAALLAGRLDQCGNPDPADWRLVKHNPSRSVYHGRIDDQEIYLKHYHGRSLIHRLRRFFGRSEAMREMAFSQYLSSRSVPTATALAARSDGGMEWLATRAVAPAVPANEWHEQQVLRGRRGRYEIQAYIVALAKLIGKMHRTGVVHQDLHCGNIMIKTDTRKPRLILMDLHRMTRRRRLSRRMMAANLAQLFHDRRFCTTRTERLRFLKHYLPVCGAGGTLRGWQVLVENFAGRHTCRQHAQRDRRIMGRNHYFSPITSPGGWRGHVVLASKRRLGGSAAAEVVLRAEDWREVLVDPESLLYGPDVTEIKDTHSARIVRRKLKVGPHELDVFIKQPRQKRLLKRLLSFVRPSRPLRAFHMGHELLTRRIATALPLAVMERRRGPLLLDSILITETVHAPHLYDFMNTWLSNPPTGDTSLSVPQQRQLAQEVLWQLGRMLQQLHDNFFAHRDLKATNIRVRWSPGERPEIVLLDLDGLAQVRFMTARRKFRGLMRLNVSLLQCPAVNHAGQLRMLLGYLRRPGSGKIHFKPYWRVLEDWSARKLRHQIRSRRRRQKAIRRPS